MPNDLYRSSTLRLQMDLLQLNDEVFCRDEHQFAYRNLMHNVRKQMELKLNQMDEHGSDRSHQLAHLLDRSELYFQRNKIQMAALRRYQLAAAHRAGSE